MNLKVGYSGKQEKSCAKTLQHLQLGNNRGASMSILKTYCKHAMQGTKLVKSANKVDFINHSASVLTQHHVAF